jgi:hypothetical protein
MRTTTSEPSLRADPTRDVYERDADVYRGRELLVPECMLLRRLRDRWADIDMLDIEALRRRGYARLRDHHHDFGLPLFYVTAAYQAARLEALGFEVLDIQDRQGRSVPSASPGSDLWLHFLRRKPGA